MDYTQYINPNIGTVGHLLTATAPTVQSPHGAAPVSYTHLRAHET